MHLEHPKPIRADPEQSSRGNLLAVTIIIIDLLPALRRCLQVRREVRDRAAAAATSGLSLVFGFARLGSARRALRKIPKEFENAILSLGVSVSKLIAQIID